MTTLTEFSPEIIVQDNHPVTTSMAVAKAFEKEHGKVIRSIRSLEVPEDFRKANFGFTSIDVKMPTGSIRKDPAFFITRDGFTILAMGFTGKRAMEFKIKYIEAFNRMESELQEKAHASLPHSENLSSAHKRDLQEIVSRRANEYPEGLMGGIYPQLWGKFKTHFRVGSYADLPDAIFEEARAFLERVPLDEPAPAKGIRPVEKPKARTPDLLSARDTLTYLERWGQDLPEPARMSFLELVGELKQVVVHDWTVLDEALLRIGTGLAMLRRYRG